MEGDDLKLRASSKYNSQSGIWENESSMFTGSASGIRSGTLTSDALGFAVSRPPEVDIASYDL